MKTRPKTHGLMVEFRSAEQILQAAQRTRLEGYTSFDAYTPYPVEGLAAELGLSKTRVPFIVLIGGLVGAAAGYYMQYWCMAVDYPLNVGGKPYHSWPAFIPITFELMVLVASFAAILGMFFLNGLPEPYHPVFNDPRFVGASQDRFFLCIEATDPKFNRTATRAFLESLQPIGDVLDVPT
jgi:hypothetical protein